MEFTLSPQIWKSQKDCVMTPLQHHYNTLIFAALETATGMWGFFFEMHTEKTKFPAKTILPFTLNKELFLFPSSLPFSTLNYFTVSIAVKDVLIFPDCVFCKATIRSR